MIRRDSIGARRSRAVRWTLDERRTGRANGAFVRASYTRTGEGTAMQYQDTCTHVGIFASSTYVAGVRSTTNGISTTCDGSKSAAQNLRSASKSRKVISASSSLTRYSISSTAYSAHIDSGGAVAATASDKVVARRIAKLD